MPVLKMFFRIFRPVLAFVFAWLLLMPVAQAAPVFKANAFADEVVAFVSGHPAARKTRNLPEWALGKPSRQQPALTLGCGGSLTVRFVDNALINVPGDDLYVFETGPDVEATRVEISVDGTHWRYVGKVAGATASLDIDAYAQADESFAFVRLTDLRQSCQSDTPGADIDAIAAIGSATRYHFASSVLFDFDQATLKPEARQVLQQWLQHFTAQSGTLQINGHTDRQGSDAYNLKLSLQRAQAVADALRPHLPDGIRLLVQGFGEQQPLDRGEDEAAAARNRRVELIYVPAAK